MRKGISFFFGYTEYSPEERAKMISDAGFDSIITSADERLDNGSLKSQVKLFRKYNLQLSSLHMQYDSKLLRLFWQEGKAGDLQKKRLIKDVKSAHKFGFSCVVVHLGGEYSQIGERRLLDVLKVCEKYEIPLAIENLNNQKLFVEVFEKIKHPYLKFCYDVGHNHFVDKDFDYLKKYGDKLIALHLHSNDGLSDQHTLNRFGSVDWNVVGKKLRVNKDIVLDYELLMNYRPEDLSGEECLKEAKTQADELEKIILGKSRIKKNV